MTDYPLGTVVVATVRGVPGQQAMRAGQPGGSPRGWVSASFVMGCRFHPHADATDIEVVYTPRMAEPEPVEWQIIAHTSRDDTRRRWVRAPWGFRKWASENDLAYHYWTDLIDPEPYRPDDAAGTP